MEFSNLINLLRRLKGNLEVRQEELRKLREMNEARDAEVAQLKVEKEQMRLREEELVTMVAGLEVQVSFIFCLLRCIQYSQQYHSNPFLNRS